MRMRISFRRRCAEEREEREREEGGSKDREERKGKEKSKREKRTFSDCRVDGDLASMSAHERRYDRQTEPRPCGERLSASERNEELTGLDERRRYSSPLIDDLDGDDRLARNDGDVAVENHANDALV